MEARTAEPQSPAGFVIVSKVEKMLSWRASDMMREGEPRHHSEESAEGVNQGNEQHWK